MRTVLISYRRTGGVLALLALTAVALAVTVLTVAVAATVLIVAVAVAAAGLLVRAVLPASWRRRRAAPATPWAQQTIEGTAVRSADAPDGRDLERLDTGKG